MAVYINSDGQLGTVTSSARFKDEIKPMDKASEAILALRPVSFRYKKQIDPQGIPQFGLVAEEVEKVNPGLVVRDQEGNPYSVRYEAGQCDVAQRISQGAPQGRGTRLARLQSNKRRLRS